ncbi:NACHT domain-containing protein [Streptomyces sp. NPDC059991]|uniref:NACHT domain-containing protein n=1 Tax=Streptomyces sp. NPDC059991 TaxID=3347028 RepID=UPI0036B3F45E
MTHETAEESRAASGQGALGAGLRRLLAESGLDKGTAVVRANRLLDGWGVRRLSASRLTERLSGQPGSNFAQLWALVAVMLVARGDLTEAEAAAAGRTGTAAGDGPPAPRTRAGHTGEGPPAPRARAGRESGAGPGRAQGHYDNWYALWESVRAEPGPGPDPGLGAYLDAAARAARVHPYPGLFGEDSPPLAYSYVPQRVAAAVPGGKVSGEHWAAAEVFAAPGGTGLLVAGPGGGKSTLLRVQVAEMAALLAERANRGAGQAFPVLVRAVKLASRGPFAHVLAAAASDALAGQLAPGTLTEDFFRGRPHPKADWLVLVDGLDEIPAPAARAALLRTLAVAAREGPYRFLVTTRPLPPNELDTATSPAARFELLPFTAEDLRGYARARFAALDGPEEHAERFAALLGKAGLADLARIPLMAAMLCRLYAQAPGERLPEGRTAVHREFVERVHAHNTHKDVIETHRRAIEALARPFQHMPDRDAVVRAASAARDELPDLVGHLAFRLLHTGAATMDEALADHPRSRPPAPLSAPDWHRFLREMLSVTGLLTVEGSHLTFPHRTFMEYHAARYATLTRWDRAGEVRHLLDSRWVKPPSWPFTRATWSMSVVKVNLRAVLGLYGLPCLTRADMSYAGFVLDLVEAHGTDLTIRYLRIARRGGAEGGTFITLQAALGTLVPTKAAEAARATLAAVALSGRRVAGEQRVLAAEILCRVGDERGIEALRAMAEDPKQLDILDQWHTPARMQMCDFVAMAPLTPYEEEDMRRRSRRDTQAMLEAVTRDPTLDEAVRREAAQVRAAFGTAIGETPATRVTRARSRPDGTPWWHRRGRRTP